MRLLFASIHSYLDPSSGAAVGTRELLDLLAARGMDCRVLCAGVLDYESAGCVKSAKTHCHNARNPGSRFFGYPKKCFRAALLSFPLRECDIL